MKALSFRKAVSLDKSNLLEEVFALLDQHEVRFCVIGGQAVNAYVEPLVSLDLDLAIAVDQVDNVKELMASGDTSKPANEGHLKTGQRKQAGRELLYPVMVGEGKKEFAMVGGVELNCEDLSGGYGNAGMRPERRLSGRKGRDGWRSEIPSRLVWQAFLARKR